MRVNQQPGKNLSGFHFVCALGLLLAHAVIHSGINAETLPLKRFTTSDGLAHDHINRIVRDSRGFLWFCTGEGLSRFDGYQFKNYTRDEGLPHRSVYDLLETPQGNYWIATGDGLVLFNPEGIARRWPGFENDKSANEQTLMFRAFRPGDAKADWAVLKLQIDAQGTLWAVSSLGFYRIDQKGRDWQLQQVYHAEWGAYQASETLLKDRDGALWTAGQNGISRVLPDGTVQIISRDVSIISLFQDKSGNVWAGTGGESAGGLYQYAYNGLAEPKLLHRFTRKDGLSSDFWIYAMLETSDGEFWVAVVDSLCLKTAKTNSSQFKAVWPNGVTALAEDSGGNIWIGTESSGAVRFSRKGFKSFDEKDGLKSTRIAAIVNGVNSEIFVLTYTDIYRFDGNRFTTVMPKGMIPWNWGWNQITFQDHAGEWWIEGIAGLQRYPRVDRFEQLAQTNPKKLYTVSDGLPGNVIFRLFEDSHGDIWIGTISGSVDCLSRWERATDKLFCYTAKDGAPANNAPTAFAEDHFGNIWIGYYTAGVVRVRNGAFQVFTAKEGVPPGFIRDIYADRAGRVWIASSSNGVARIDEPNTEHPKLVHISTTEGLSSNQTNCFTEDDFGRIYIGTGRGVNRLETQSGRVKVFTTADGLPENLINLCKRDKDGTLWFGMNHGLSRFVPGMDTEPTPPPIFISDVLVNGSPFRKLSELGNTLVENLELNPEQRQMQVDFFGLGFSTGETLRYQYKLDNSDWSLPSALRTLNLNLSPGAHRLLLRAINAEGVSSLNPAVISFSIARPVWQRWWFLTLAAVAIIGTAYLLYRYRVAQLLKVERVRTRIATDLHDDIGASLSRMAILSEVVKQQTGSNGAQSTGLLTEIADSARGLVDSMSDIVWSIDPRRDDLQSVVRRIRQFASDVLEAKGIEWELHVPPEVEKLKLDPNERQHLFLIFKEAINNVARHGDGTKSVSLSIALQGRQLSAEIKDDGCGFTPKEPDEARSKGLGGNGLPNMCERAQQLGGRLEIASSPGAGTRLTLQVPIKR